VWRALQASRGEAPRGPAWRVRLSMRWVPPIGVIVFGSRVMNAIVVAPYMHRSVVRIGVVGVRFDAPGARKEGQPVLDRRAAAVVKLAADTPAHRMREEVKAWWSRPERAGW